jgi:hypothetical protein
MSEKDKSQKNGTFHEDLKGFDIKVNAFGEMESSFEIDRINEFLNEQVDDKKLKRHKLMGESKLPK